MVMGDRDIPLEVLQNLRRWAWLGNLLRIVHVVLGVVATGAGLYVATFTERDPTYTKLGTFTAAFCLALLTAFNIGGKADSIRRAWRHVTAACMLYKGDAAFTLERLVKAYTEAEAMIGDVPFQGVDPKASPQRGSPTQGVGLVGRPTGDAKR
jgi:hypothetical protein